MQASSRPRHFHLLSDGELQLLQPVLRHLGDQRDALLDEFYKRYLSHFGAQVTLGWSAFAELYGRDLDACGRSAL